ncbi:hypothetical protein B0H14DRAFT_3672415 [Mycena olivaceomarginata]|nr:hypothetical protein B0H14DRAFT_3672415 [Mycena olivaceomarginata]
MLLCALSVLFSLSRVYIRRSQKQCQVVYAACKPRTTSMKNSETTRIRHSPAIRGLPSLAIDWVGVGMSSRPVNASDVQYATEAAVASQLARQLKNVSIFPGVQPFKKVIGIGHAQTGALIVAAQHTPPAADSQRAGWMTRSAGVGLGPTDYLTTSSRNHLLRPPTQPPFSPHAQFDNFTKDVGSIASLLQVPISTLPTQYTGPVARLGSEDQLLCLGTRARTSRR